MKSRRLRPEALRMSRYCRVISWRAASASGTTFFSAMANWRAHSTCNHQNMVSAFLRWFKFVGIRQSGGLQKRRTGSFGAHKNLPPNLTRREIPAASENLPFPFWSPCWQSVRGNPLRRPPGRALPAPSRRPLFAGPETATLA